MMVRKYMVTSVFLMLAGTVTSSWGMAERQNITMPQINAFIKKNKTANLTKPQMNAFIKKYKLNDKMIDRLQSNGLVANDQANRAKTMYEKEQKAPTPQDNAMRGYQKAWGEVHKQLLQFARENRSFDGENLRPSEVKEWNDKYKNNPPALKKRLEEAAKAA